MAGAAYRTLILIAHARNVQLLDWVNSRPRAGGTLPGASPVHTPIHNSLTPGNLITDGHQVKETDVTVILGCLPCAVYKTSGATFSCDWFWIWLYPRLLYVEWRPNITL